MQYRILCATPRDRFQVRDLNEKRKASSEQKKTDKEIYDVWKLVGEYKRSSDLHQLRKTAWKLPTLILGSVCERVSFLPRYTVNVVSVYQPKIVLYPFHQTTSSFDPVACTLQKSASSSHQFEKIPASVKVFIAEKAELQCCSHPNLSSWLTNVSLNLCRISTSLPRCGSGKNTIKWLQLERGKKKWRRDNFQ